MGGERILIIMGDELLGADIAMTLEEAGFEITMATSSAEGMSKLYEGFPALVIIGSELPTYYVKDVCVGLLKLCGIPVIILGSEGEEAVAMLEAGADACMPSPLNLTELLARTRSLLWRSRRTDRDIPRKDITPYSRRRIIGKGATTGTSISQTEFRLLLCLMINEGRLLESSQLINEAWGGKQVSTECLKFYVGRLRKKMATSLALPGRIVNQRGVGYRYSRTGNGNGKGKNLAP